MTSTETPSYQPPTVTTDLGAVVTKVACCPVENFERCVLAGGEGHLRLLGARQAIGGGPDDVVLKPLPDISLAHEGRIDAVAWAISGCRQRYERIMYALRTPRS